jgi:hypothetical protein
MKHAYLTKEEIDRSYRRGAITLQEATDLLKKLEKCTNRAVQVHEARRRNNAGHQVA